LYDQRKRTVRKRSDGVSITTIANLSAMIPATGAHCVRIFPVTTRSRSFASQRPEAKAFRGLIAQRNVKEIDFSRLKKTLPSIDIRRCELSMDHESVRVKRFELPMSEDQLTCLPE